MRVLVLGASGMIGHTLFRTLSESVSLDVWGTVRDSAATRFFSNTLQQRLLINPNILHHDTLVAMLNQVKPDVVINGTGFVKQLSQANDPLVVLPINALFPHQLASLCALIQARVVQFSTDCVFSGKKGSYDENDVSDADDLYGKSKYIGEVATRSHVLTLRTSTIGHELQTHHGLLEWFLSERTEVRGFSRAVFSGLPTLELARIVRDYVLPNPALHGLYHVASSPINKCDLLMLIADVYQHAVRIKPDDSLVVDRSLNNVRFSKATGYNALSWPEQIALMHQDHVNSRVE